MAFSSHGFGDDGKLQSQLNTFPIPRCHAYSPVFGFQKRSSPATCQSFCIALLLQVASGSIRGDGTSSAMFS